MNRSIRLLESISWAQIASLALASRKSCVRIDGTRHADDHVTSLTLPTASAASSVYLPRHPDALDQRCGAADKCSPSV